MVMPGDNVALTVELITPVAMDKGLRFAIREGGRTVGAGTVTEIIEEANDGAERTNSHPSEGSRSTRAGSVDAGNGGPREKDRGNRRRSDSLAHIEKHHDSFALPSRG